MHPGLVCVRHRPRKNPRKGGGVLASLIKQGRARQARGWDCKKVSDRELCLCSAGTDDAQMAGDGFETCRQRGSLKLILS